MLHSQPQHRMFLVPQCVAHRLPYIRYPRSSPSIGGIKAWSFAELCRRRSSLPIHFRGFAPSRGLPDLVRNQRLLFVVVITRKVLLRLSTRHS